MRIYKHIRSNWMTQKWGANDSYILKGIRPFVFVTKDTPNAISLYEDIGLKGHPGTDRASKYKEPVYFPVAIPGIEWEGDTQTDSSGSIHVIIRSKQPVPLAKLPEHVPGSLKMIQKQYKDLGGKLYLMFRYDHLYAGIPKDRSKVVTGQLIGYADSTGASSGNHVHDNMKVSDSQSWFYIDGDNGYAGSIDTAPYYTNTFVLDVLKAQSTDIKALQLTVIDLASQVVALLQQIIKLKSK